MYHITGHIALPRLRALAISSRILLSVVAISTAGLAVGQEYANENEMPEEGPPMFTGEFKAVAPRASPCPLTYFPVRGRHDTGIFKPVPWKCGRRYSNSDYRRGPSCYHPDAHRGTDIAASVGTPVVATVAGTVVQAEYNAYSGNQVRIRDTCGWSHYSIHLKSIAPGLKKGQTIKAGAVIGYVGKTGSSSGGVPHLHYSIYRSNNYCDSVDPHPYLVKVESKVCYVPDACRVWGFPC